MPVVISALMVYISAGSRFANHAVNWLRSEMAGVPLSKVKEMFAYFTATPPVMQTVAWDGFVNGPRPPARTNSG